MAVSFSEKVRAEICSTINDNDRRFACLYGMILFSRGVSGESICFQTESVTSSEFFEDLVRKVFHNRIAVRSGKRRWKNSADLYTHEITRSEDVSRILGTYHIRPGERAIDSEIVVNNSVGAFSAGVFLACGSVNDPSKEYHLEFTVPSQSLSDELIKLLSGIGVSAGSILRRGQRIVYIKGSEYIEDTLTFIGAQQCTLELMNVKIYKDVRNKANRIANCDSANIDKILNASLRQVRDIELIEKTSGLGSLPEDLREIAKLRLDNTDMSLQEIGQSLSPPISRSGVSHRFRRIAEIADRIRMREGGHES